MLKQNFILDSVLKVLNYIIKAFRGKKADYPRAVWF